jgi:hypothetical protein
LATHFSPGNVEALLLTSGKRLEHLALATGKSFYTVRGYVRGDIEPSSSTVATMADELGCDPGDLFETDEPVPA